MFKLFFRPACHMLSYLAALLLWLAFAHAQCYSGGSETITPGPWGMQRGCSGISGGKFSGRIVSYNGDKFSVILFTEDNFLAWKAEKKSYCINPGCTETIEGKAWEFSYSFPQQTDTYWLVMLCENALMDCHLEVDITWQEKPQGSSGSLGVDIAVIVGAAVLFVCLIIGCAYMCKQCWKMCGKARQQGEDHQVMSPNTNGDDEKEEADPHERGEEPFDEQEENSEAALTKTVKKKKAPKNAMKKEASVAAV